MSSLDRATVEQMTWRTIREEDFDALQEGWLRQEEALRELLPVAAIANDGDPWFCTDAGIHDAEERIDRARAVLASRPLAEAKP